MVLVLYCTIVDTVVPVVVVVPFVVGQIRVVVELGPFARLVPIVVGATWQFLPEPSGVPMTIVGLAAFPPRREIDKSPIPIRLDPTWLVGPTKDAY